MNQPRLRFKEFKGEWENSTIGNNSTIVRGASPRPIKDPKWFSKDSDVGWLRISDVTKQNGKIKFIKQRISKLGEKKTRVLTSPHLLLSIAASVGLPAINYVSTGVHDGFIIFKNLKINQNFMFQWFLKFKPNWNKYGQPGSQLNLNSSLVSNQNINIPDSIEQQKIGQFFQNLDQQIELQSDKLEHLKQSKQGYLQKIFPSNSYSNPILRFNKYYLNWKIISLDKIVHWIKGSGLSKKVIHNEQIGFPIVHYADLYKFGNVQNSVYHWSKSNEGTVIPNNSLLFPMSDVTPNGLATTTSLNVSNVKAGADTLIGEIKKEYSSDFLSFEINWNKKLILRLVVGTSVRHIHSKDLSHIKLSIPSLPEQHLIGKFFSHLDRLIDLQQQKVDHLKRQKQAYLQKMFV